MAGETCSSHAPARVGLYADTRRDPAVTHGAGMRAAPVPGSVPKGSAPRPASLPLTATLSQSLPGTSREQAASVNTQHTQVTSGTLRQLQAAVRSAHRRPRLPGGQTA